MTVCSKIVTSVLAASVLSVGIGAAQAAQRPGITPKPVVTSQQMPATAKKGTKAGAIKQANATADAMIAILHKYGL
jgi:hypothetical protein